jgi:hypothetical protein
MSGHVYLYEGASLTAPALTEVSGCVTLNEGATLTAPALTTSGYVTLRKGATLTAPALTMSGYVTLNEGATLTAPKLTEVSGHVTLREGASLTAPKLTEVSGHVTLREGASLTAPALTEVSGHVYLYEGASLTAPKLYPDGFGKFTVLDDIGCVVLSTKQAHGVTVLLCRHSKIRDQKIVGNKFYVAQSGNHNAHGKTIDEAVRELQFKTGDRDIEQYRNMPKSTKKSPDDWAFVYRMITGACQYGTRDFMARKGKLKKSYTLTEILAETKGAYGHETFAKVVTGGAA